jgi:glutamate-1-semialdehyde 2,1-aminomutase
MAAGIVTLEELRSDITYKRLEITSIYLEDTLCRAAESAEVSVRVNRAGSLLTMFFSGGEVTDYVTALASDRDRYAAFFRGMLTRGIFLAPSQFEAMFVSTVHTDDDIVATGEAAEASLHDLR